MLTNEYGEKVHAPGAAAIDKSLRRIYDFDNCCINFDDEAGQDILPRIAVFPVTAGSDPFPHEAHWHFVTYGFTDVFGVFGPSEYSGRGFEMSFRLAMTPEEEEEYNRIRNYANNDGVDPRLVDLVPTWPRSMLNGLGRYMEMSGQVFGTNESFRLGQSQFKIAGAIMAEDPVLTGEHETPFGKFFFMQVCGLHHQADYDMIWEWSCQGVLDIISQLSPMRITNTEKPSFLTIPKIKAEIDRRIEEEGSQLRNIAAPNTCSYLKLNNGYRLKIDMLAIFRVKTLLTRRLPFRRIMSVRGRDSILEFMPADGVSDDGVGILPLPDPVMAPMTEIISFKETVDQESGRPMLLISLSNDKVQELADLIRVEPGVYTISQDGQVLEIEVTYAV